MGEHPDLLEEMDKAIDKYAEANEKFATLVKLTQEKKDGTKEEPTLFESMD